MTETSMLPYADALSHEAQHWHTHQWGRMVRNVRRARGAPEVRIVKAMQRGNRRRAQALQRLLVGSYSAKVLAVRRVTENEGSRTAGVDGKRWSTPAEKMTGVKGLEERPYRAQPLLRKYIPKQNGKVRPLGGCPLGATMQDRAKQALYLFALDPVAETTADAGCPLGAYAFRRERSCADAIEQCFRVLYHKEAAQWILEGDIKACFDQIAHPWLMEHIPINRTVLRQWLKAGYLEKRTLYPTETGTPQGGIIFQPNRVPIRRHIKVIGDANPYEPRWEPYFEQRRYRRVADELPRRPKLVTLFRLQKGLCPICNQPITKETGWNCHHILWRVYGGGDEIDNLLLLHPTCHQQLHNPNSDAELLRLR